MAHAFELVDEVDGFKQWCHKGNHLDVLTFATPVAPVVCLGVVYRVGSRNESTGHTGATHMLEHLMFKGTERFNRERGNDMVRVMQRLGAACNANTWLDRTTYYEILPVEHLGLAAEIEADRMRKALVREEDLASERTVVLNELERGENDPGELLMQGSYAHAFLEHPYHHPTIGWRCDVEHMGAEVLRAYYDTYYHPNNATVMVCGDVDEPQTLAILEQHFGALAASPRPIPEVHAVEGPQLGERRFEIRRAGVVGAVTLSWRAPDGLHDDVPALSVLAQVLSDGVTARLYQRLVERNHCLSVHAMLNQLRDPGLFQVFATLAPGESHDLVEEIIREEVAQLGRHQPEAPEVARAKICVRTDLAFHRESPGEIVASLTEAVAMGDWRRFVTEMDQVEAVQAEDLVRVASQYLVDRSLTVGRFVPEGDSGPLPQVPGTGPRPCYLHEPFAKRVQRLDMDCGARLAVLRNPHAPTVNIAGSLQAGLAMAGDGRLSVPAFTALMLDRGCAGRSRLDLARELEDHGLDLSVEASGSGPTSVYFSAHGLAEQLPRLLSLTFDVLRRPTFEQQEIDRLKDRIRGAILRERQETFAQAYAAMARRLYPLGYPQSRRPPETRLAEVEALTRDELQQFHARVYGPESLAMAVVGDVEAQTVARLVEQGVAGWQAGAAGAPEWSLPAPGPPGVDRIQVPDRPNLDVLVGHRGLLERCHEDYAEAVIANACLGQSTITSRLGLVLRDREGLTYGVYSRFFGLQALPGPWAIFFSVSPRSLERAIDLCTGVAAEYVRNGPTDEELADERTSQAGAYRLRLATNAGVARELVSVMTVGISVATLDELPERFLGVSRDGVLAAVRRHIRPEELTVAVAGSLES